MFDFRQFLIKIIFTWLYIELFRSKNIDRAWNMDTNKIYT